MPDRPYTAAEVDAAVQALADPQRLAHAQEIVTHIAPSLQGVLNDALTAGGWFSAAQRQQLEQIAATADERERMDAIAALIAEETQLGMLVGVAVGFELARELADSRRHATVDADAAMAEETEAEGAD